MDWKTVKYWWKTSDVIFATDSLEFSYDYGRLRALPTLNRIGQVMNTHTHSTTAPYRFTYPKQWRQLGSVEQFAMEPHEWRLLQDLDELTHPIGIIASNYYETQTPYSIGPLLACCRRAKQPVYIVADEERFQIQGATRPLRDEPYVHEFGGGFSDLYTAIKDFYGQYGFHLPLSDTRNLFLQDNAILYNMIHDRDSVATARSLFEVLSEAPYLPLYDAMVRIFNRDDSKGATALPESELDGFRKWLRRRIEWENSTAKEVAYMLNNAVLVDANIFAAPTRVNHPTTRLVREHMSDFDSSISPIHALYERWLTENTVE